jgi:hypothetical protein
MKIPAGHVSAVEALGYTPEEAHFLYLVATYSGYFVPRQFIAFVRAKGRMRSHRFSRKVESRGHASWREYPGLGGVYHLSSRTLYRRIDKENLGNRRRHSIEFIRSRLVLLDFILENPQYDYFETQDERVAYFSTTWNVPKDALPAKAYKGSAPSSPTLRYFVDRFPLFLDAADRPAGAPSVSLSYVDSGGATIGGLAHHLSVYKGLLSHLPDFRFLYISDSSIHFMAAERCFRSFVSSVLQGNLTREILRYFRLRAAWDDKQYGTLSHDDVEWLDQANHRFEGQQTDEMYALWRAGKLADDTLAARSTGARPTDGFQFIPYLVRGRPINQAPPSGELRPEPVEGGSDPL